MLEMFHSGRDRALIVRRVTIAITFGAPKFVRGVAQVSRELGLKFGVSNIYTTIGISAPAECLNGFTLIGL